jgi:homopolymeric O-antigen transport system permease protein
MKTERLPVAAFGPSALFGLLPASIRALVEAPLRNVPMWTTLALMDIVQSYRRTVLGPAWITINLAIFTFAMSVVYGALFGIPTRDYVGYVACGMIAWMWVSAMLMEVGNTFMTYGNFIKSTSIDKSLFIWTTVFRQLIVLAHNLVVYVVLVVIGIVPITVYSLAFIPVVMVMFLISVPFTAVTAILFVRYRDLTRLISSSIIVLMMITPIFWQPHMLGGWRSHFIHLNPIYYIIEFIRTPLLGKPLNPLIVIVILAMGLCIWILGAAFYRRYQKYVVFWL